MIRDAIVNGYNIPLLSWPPEFETRNNSTARDPENREFLDEDIRSLLASGAVYEVSKKL